MNCPSCGAAMRLEGDKEYFTCDFCKNIYFPDKNEDGVRVLDEASELSCPLCSIPLVHAALSGQRVLYCSRCRGMLLHMDIFVALLDDLRARSDGASAIPHRPDPKELQRRISCPQCHQQMETHYYCGPGNVVIDDCSRCSLDWLDYGELMRIVRAPDHTYHDSLED